MKGINKGYSQRRLASTKTDSEGNIVVDEDRVLDIEFTKIADKTMVLENGVLRKYKGESVQGLEFGEELMSIIRNTFVVKEKLNIAGRGTIFVIDLKQFKDLPDRIYDASDLDSYVKVGQYIFQDGLQYEIRGLEYSRKLMEPPFIQKSLIGVQVREVTNSRG
jgi:hypothetical protein